MVGAVSDTTATVLLRIDYRSGYTLVSSNEPDYTTGRNAGTYVVLKSDRYTYLLFAPKNKPLTFRPWQVAPGFSAPILTAMVQRGRYRVGLFRTRPDGSTVQFTNQFVEVP